MCDNGGMGRNDMYNAVLSPSDSHQVQGLKKTESDLLANAMVMESKAKMLMNQPVKKTLEDGTVVMTTAWEEMLMQAYQNDMANPKLSGKDLLAWKELAGEKKAQSVDLNISLVDQDLKKGALD